MPKNKIADLRDHLFETIESLKDDEKPLDVERAKAICQVAGAIIETAKVEVKYAEVTGQQYASEFFEELDPREKLPPARPMRALADAGK